MRYLCYMCLARGELEAPLVLMEYLATVRGVNQTLLNRYVMSAIDLGLSVEETWQRLSKLREDDYHMALV